LHWSVEQVCVINYYFIDHSSFLKWATENNFLASHELIIAAIHLVSVEMRPHAQSCTRAGCNIVILLTADNSFLFFKAKEVEL